MHSLITDFITTFWTPLFVVIFFGILAYALWPAQPRDVRGSGENAAARGLTR